MNRDARPGHQRAERITPIQRVETETLALLEQLGFDPARPQLWVADPHRYGRGKTHVVHPECWEMADFRDQKTACGKWLHETPGCASQHATPTCRACFKVLKGQVNRKEWEQHWRTQRAQDEHRRQQENLEWWRRYNAYLESPAWQERRRLVLRRAGGLCEGCGKNRAVHVHHLTYEHVSAEFLWELCAVCKACHDRLHEHPG